MMNKSFEPNGTVCNQTLIRDDSTGAVVFSLYFVGNLMCLLYSIGLVRRARKSVAFWLALPLGFCLCFETLTIAVFEARGNSVTSATQVARQVAHSFIKPIFLVLMFEIVYIIHKRRSVNFCGMTFDQGHRSHELWSSRLMRMSMWIIALGITAVELVSTILIVQEGSILPGIVSERFCTKSLLRAIDQDTSFETIVDIIPSVLLMVFSFYFGLLLWRYGTHYALSVNATYFNSWMVVFVGACLLLISFWLPGHLAAFLVDGGLLLLHMAMVWAATESLSELALGEEVKMYLSKRNIATTDDGQGSTSTTGRRDSSPPSPPPEAIDPPQLDQIVEVGVRDVVIT